MPKVAVPSQQRVFRNHPSWEDDPAARDALGPTIAKWLAQGVLEYVEWDDRQPVLLQPCGAVPKGSAPFYRLITDARFGNNMYSDWGVSYTSAAKLTHVLHKCDFTWSTDLADAYHLSVFAGCGGGLRPTRRPVVSGTGEVTWMDGFVNGCDPSSCLGGCDKDMSGISLDGHVFRFAACQFGQKTAGSPLNSLVMSVARYFARLPRPVHVAAWVDDLHFSMSTPPHPDCDGFKGGCPVCVTYYGHAVKAQALWHKKAAILGLPQSPGKGHTVDQGGPFCGVHVDPFVGLYRMLPEKLESCNATILALKGASESSPRLLAQGRGKAGHYGCAVAFLSLGCASVSQAMHQTELDFAHTTPLVTEEKGSGLDWDARVQVSERCRAALSFMLLALRVRGSEGQPLWPLPASSVFGAFLARRKGPRRIIVISLNAGTSGWRMALRFEPGSAAISGGQSWVETCAAAQAEWMAPLPLVGSPDRLIYYHALAASAALRLAAQHTAVAGTNIIFRSPCREALLALRNGDYRRPAVQDAALLLGAACLDLELPTPLFLPSSGLLRGPARLGSAEPDWDTSSSLLRSLLRDVAQSQGAAFTLDPFATASTTLAPRYFSDIDDPAAEGVDAFAQPDWGSSMCPACKTRHREFLALVPPHAAVAQALQKAKCDQARGVMAVPFQISAPWWPLAMGASLSHDAPDARFAPCFKLKTPVAIRHPSGSSLRYIAVLAFDFLLNDPNSVPQPCEEARAHRGPAPHFSAEDSEDARLLDLQLSS
jgi:hypothetical protein